MKYGAQIGLAVAGGYVLGRFHKVKWAVALAALGAGKRLPGIQGELLDRGKKLLSSTTASSTLTGEVGSHLVQAGKSAAVAAVSNRIDSISDSLHERTETMLGAGDDEPDDAKDTGEAPDEEETGSRPAQRSTRTRKPPASRSRSGSGRSNSGNGSSSGSRSSSGGQAKAKTSSRAPKSASASRRSASGRSGGGSR